MAKMTDRAGKYAGMTVLEAREAVVKALEDKGLLIKSTKTTKTG
jgi:valyl-tRNA synthetase